MSDHTVLHSGYHHPVLREWQATNTQIKPENLIYPIFITDEEDDVQEISSMPGQSRFGINTLQNALSPLVEKGLKCVLIFGVPEKIKKEKQNKIKNPGQNVKGQPTRARTKRGRTGESLIEQQMQRTQTLYKRRHTVLKKLNELQTLTGTQSYVYMKTRSGQQYQHMSDGMTKEDVLSALNSKETQSATQECPPCALAEEPAPPPATFPSPTRLATETVETEEPVPGPSRQSARQKAKDKKKNLQEKMEHCGECGGKHKGNREYEVWVGCDKKGCPNWYHTSCLGWTVPDEKYLKFLKFHCPQHRIKKKN